MSAQLLSKRALSNGWRMFSPEVEFCGYSIPHPSEAKMNVRIQTYGQSFPLLPFPSVYVRIQQFPSILTQFSRCIRKFI